MTRVYFAWTRSTQAETVLAHWAWDERPLDLLVALPYLRDWDRLSAKHGWTPAHLMLDSGAFSAWQSGHEVDIEELVARSLEPRFHETVGLDVIGSAEGSRRNLDHMRRAGSPAMPVFHIGDPWDLLDYYCATWPKVGLSCRFGESEAQSLRFYDLCYARRWPHRFHSFGWVARKVLLRFPFHSADSSSWANGPCRFRWLVGEKRGKFKGTGVSAEDVARYIEVHIRRVLDDADRAAQQWRRELAAL